MPLRIETLFCDAAIERDLLSGEELERCMAEAGDDGSVHQAAIDLGLLTPNQARRVYAKIYATLDKRYRKCPETVTYCPACDAEVAFRFRLTYGIVPCPECLEAIPLVEGDEEAPTEEQVEVESVELDVSTERAPRKAREAPRRLAGHEVIEELGTGGTGTVYLARNDAGEQVAIKVIRRDSQSDAELKRIISECKLLRELSHPKIRRLHKLKGDEEAYYLIMEYVEGESLEQLRARQGRIKPRVVLQVAYAVASALEHAHEHNILHRDVKPHNILLSTDRKVKLTDFGVAISTDAISAWTMTGQIAGTPSYMSPEQCRGEKLDARSDLYALGMTMYHCLAGRLPFEGDPLSVVYRQVHGRVPSLYEHVRDLPDPIVQLVGRLLAREPADRYPDATSLKEDLRYVISGKAPRARPHGQHISLAQLDEARKIQQEMEESLGAHVPIEEVLAQQGWIGSGTESEEIEAEEPYCCGCSGSRELSEAVELAFVCPDCETPLRFDPEVNLQVIADHLIVEPIGDAITADEDRTDQIARHLKAACQQGLRDLVIDLSQAGEVEPRHSGWMVDVAQSAMQLRGTVSVLFPNSRSRDSFCSMGFDQFVRVHRSRKAFYEKQLDCEPPEPAGAVALPPAAPQRKPAGQATRLVRRPRAGRKKRPRRRASSPPQSGVFRARPAPEPVEEEEESAAEVTEKLQDEFYLAYEAGDYASALDVLMAQDEDTISGQGLYYRGICNWRLGYLEEAHDDLTEVVERDPGNAEAYYVRGLVNQGLGDADEAILDYGQTIELAPRHVKAYCNRAAICYSIGELDDAAEDFQAALKLNAKHVRSLYGLGTIHLDRDQLMMAGVLLGQALDFDPDFAPAYYSQARLAVRQGRLPEALQHLRQAIRRNPRLYKKSKDEPDFAPLRDDPKLRAHYKGLKLDG